ncbi:MAG: hypothetical protein HWN79_06920 [Candidatus Lokiarchaeota archaeon]|nr:hypothetical protein [Candidatus Lokiarchaeota archaeon]
MSNSKVNQLFFSQIINIKKHFFNIELKLSKFFYEITSFFPVCVIRINEFIFFFVKSGDYFAAKPFLRKLRHLMKSKKILIIREELTLIRIIFSFFEDTYIHNVMLIEGPTRDIINVLFLFKKDRAVAVGIDGSYIKAVNYIFRNYITLNYPFNKTESYPLELRCNLTTV